MRGQGFLEGHVRLRHRVPVGLSFICMATASPQWRSINQATQGSFNGGKEKKVKTFDEEYTASLEKLIESKKEQKREVGAATASHTVLLYVQHKHFQLHQKSVGLKIMFMIYTLQSQHAVQATAALFKSNSMHFWVSTELDFMGSWHEKSNGSFLRLALGAH